MAVNDYTGGLFDGPATGVSDYGPSGQIQEALSSDKLRTDEVTEDLPDERQRVERWCKRWDAAKALKDTWEKKYTPAKNLAYYTGEQYKAEERKDSSGNERLSINKIGAAIRATMPSLMFYYPFAKVTGVPEREDTPGQTLDERAQLLQDTANSIVRDPDTLFMEQTRLALLEAQWAFGCVEVGYDASFEDNPTAQRPALEERSKESAIERGPVDAAQGIPKVNYECFFVKYVSASRVFCSREESSVVKELDWVGYYDWMYLEDVKKAPAYAAKVEGLKPTAQEKSPSDRSDDISDMVKIYKVWDLRTHTKYVWADGHKKFLLEAHFDRLPLFFIRFEVEPGKFYPIPPIYHMLKPQDDYNQSRDLLRRLRDAIVPRYVYDENALRPEDIEKFESADPGVYIPQRTANPDPIRPVQQPSWSEGALRALTIAGEEFTEVSGVSPESRQVAQSKTAYQAGLVNQKEQVQDSHDRWLTARWLGEIIKELLQLAIDRMVLPRWIQRNADPFSPYLQQYAARLSELYQQITFQDLQEADSVVRWDVTVDVDSMTPATEEQKQAKWNQALIMLANPSVGRILGASPELLKHTLDLNGIHSAQEQRLIGEALMREAQMQAAMAAQAGKPLQSPGIAPQAGTGAPQVTQNTLEPTQLPEGGPQGGGA